MARPWQAGDNSFAVFVGIVNGKFMYLQFMEDTLRPAPTCAAAGIERCAVIPTAVRVPCDCPALTAPPTLALEP